MSQTMICPERKCTRREECAKDGGHAAQHQEDKFCKDGCHLISEGGHRHKCIKY